MSAFIIRWLITTVAVFAAEKLLPGISCASWGSLIGASLLLGIINALVRPVLLILSLPFILVTMGLFIFVVNALMLMLVAAIIPGFNVDGFWWAFFGSVIISVVSWLFSAFFRGSDGKVYSITHHGAVKQANARLVE